MRKLILQEFISINGLASDENDSPEFIQKHGGVSQDLNKDLLKFLDSIDLILLGAETYKLFVEFWPTATVEDDIIADKLNRTSKLVFSSSLEKASWGKWEDAKLVNSNASEAIRKLKKEPGKDMVLWGSISLAQSLMLDGIIDEYQLRICPVILGGGRSLYPDDFGTKDMKMIGSKTYSNGVVLLKYQFEK